MKKRRVWAKFTGRLAELVRQGAKRPDVRQGEDDPTDREAVGGVIRVQT